MAGLEPIKIPDLKSIPIWLWTALTLLSVAVSVATMLVASQLDWFKEKNHHTLESRKLDFQLLEFGIGILSTAPEAGDDCTDNAAKKWAVGILGKYSDVPFELPAGVAICEATISFTGPSLTELGKPNAPEPPEAIAPQGWIALGYVAKGDASNVSFDEANFTLADGSTIDPNQISGGGLVKARLAMNMRPAPAGWGKVVRVIPAGRCVRITNTRILPAGTTFQMWGAAQIADC